MDDVGMVAAGATGGAGLVAETWRTELDRKSQTFSGRPGFDGPEGGEDAAPEPLEALGQTARNTLGQCPTRPIAVSTRKYPAHSVWEPTRANHHHPQDARCLVAAGIIDRSPSIPAPSQAKTPRFGRFFRGPGFGQVFARPRLGPRPGRGIFYAADVSPRQTASSPGFRETKKGRAEPPTEWFGGCPTYANPRGRRQKQKNRPRARPPRPETSVTSGRAFDRPAGRANGRWKVCWRSPTADPARRGPCTHASQSIPAAPSSP